MRTVFCQKSGFTLAEVLITLGIIGVVAAMTLPALIQKQQEKVIVNKLKKVDTTIAQAFMLAQSEYGPPEGWDWGVADDPDKTLVVLKKYFVPYMKVNRVCPVRGNCFPNVTYKRLNGTNHKNYYNLLPAMILNDGTLIGLWTGVLADGTLETASSVLCYLYVDINGSHLPNQIGKDFFMFAVTPKGTWAVGLEGERYGKRNFSNSCLRNQDVYLNGIGCTAWVIYNENMDYLHCDGLSWNKKTKCR